MVEIKTRMWWHCKRQKPSDPCEWGAEVQEVGPCIPATDTPAEDILRAPAWRISFLTTTHRSLMVNFNLYYSKGRVALVVLWLGCRTCNQFSLQVRDPVTSLLVNDSGQVVHTLASVTIWYRHKNHGAGHMGAAVWAPPKGRHHLGAHRLGMKYFQTTERNNSLTTDINILRQGERRQRHVLAVRPEN